MPLMANAVKGKINFHLTCKNFHPSVYLCVHIYFPFYFFFVFLALIFSRVKAKHRSTQEENLNNLFTLFSFLFFLPTFS